MKKKLFLFLPIILIELFCNSIVFSQCGDDVHYHIGEQFTSKRLVYNCNNTFHCHEFVRLYFESSCPKPTWYTPLNSICSWNPAQYEFPNTNYWDLNTYIKVDEQFANIARYTRSPEGTNHSQVKDSQYPWKYISKYDKQGPVVGHNLRSSYYDIERPDGDYTFYFYLGPITGNPTITNANPVYFSVNVNKSVNYEWSVSPSSQEIVSLSPGSDDNIIKVTPLESGSVTLQLVATKHSSVSQDINLSVQQLPPPPPPPLLSGTYDNAGIYNQTLLTTNRVSVGGVFIRVSYPEATTYTWQKTSGNINGYFVPGPTASFNMTSGGSITLLVTAKNGSVPLTSKYITFYNYYW